MNRCDPLRAEIEATRLRYHALLQRIPDTAFNLPSANPAWTVGEVLYHMSLAPRLIIADVGLFIRLPWLGRLLPRLVPKALFDGLNARLTRFGARKLSRQFLAEQYDAAHRIALRALDSAAGENFDRSLPYPNWDPLLSGEVSLARLFHYLKDHFEAHAAEIERLIPEEDPP